MEKLDYMTSPGWMSGGDSRKKMGLKGGPTSLITKGGLFRFEEQSKEMYLAGIFPQTTIEQIQQEVPWKLKTAEDFGKNFEPLEPPTLEDLKFIRDFDPFFGIGGHEARRLQAQPDRRSRRSGGALLQDRLRMQAVPPRSESIRTCKC